VSAAVAAAARILQEECHRASFKAGWWVSPKTNAVYTKDELLEVTGWKSLLIHSEVSEAAEGFRKDKMDDHLPHRKSAEVELADAAIRIFDLAGMWGFDLGAAIQEKMAYNANRADHKPANRQAEGGKRY
jgi:NTP pyrophosphatase (non-canonical NTP hydrolase)